MCCAKLRDPYLPGRRPVRDRAGPKTASRRGRGPAPSAARRPSGRPSRPFCAFHAGKGALRCISHYTPRPRAPLHRRRRERPLLLVDVLARSPARAALKPKPKLKEKGKEEEEEARQVFLGRARAARGEGGEGEGMPRTLFLSSCTGCRVGPARRGRRCVGRGPPLLLIQPSRVAEKRRNEAGREKKRGFQSPSV